MFRKCPRQYFFRYIEGLKIPPKSAMFKGTCFHEYTEHEFTQKADTGNDIPMDEATDLFVEKFDEGKGGVDWKDDKPEEVKGKGLKMVEAFHSEKAPGIMPRSKKDLERKIFIEFEEDVPSILMYLDMIDIDNVLRDTKTTGKAPGAEDTSQSSQLTVYSMAVRTEEPETFPEDQPVHVQHDYVYQTPSGNVQLIEQRDVRTQDHINAFLDDYQNVTKQIDFCSTNDVWPQAPDVAWWCSPSACGYWDKCKGKVCSTNVSVTKTKYEPPKPMEV
jgi:hypothetical protein